LDNAKDIESMMREEQGSPKKGDPTRRVLSGLNKNKSSFPNRRADKPAPFTRMQSMPVCGRTDTPPRIVRSQSMPVQRPVLLRHGASFNLIRDLERQESMQTQSRTPGSEMNLDLILTDESDHDNRSDLESEDVYTPLNKVENVGKIVKEVLVE